MRNYETELQNDDQIFNNLQTIENLLMKFNREIDHLKREKSKLNGKESEYENMLNAERENMEPLLMKEISSNLMQQLNERIANYMMFENSPIIDPIIIIL